MLSRRPGSQTVRWRRARSATSEDRLLEQLRFQWLGKEHEDDQDGRDVKRLGLAPVRAF